MFSTVSLICFLHRASVGSTWWIAITKHGRATGMQDDREETEAAECFTTVSKCHKAKALHAATAGAVPAALGALRVGSRCALAPPVGTGEAGSDGGGAFGPVLRAREESQGSALLRTCCAPKKVLGTWEKSKAKAACPAGGQGPRQAFSSAARPEQQLRDSRSSHHRCSSPGHPRPRHLRTPCQASLQISSFNPRRAQRHQHQTGL